MLSNIRSLGQNLFIFTGILILFRSSGSSTAIASIGLGLWVLIIEIMQRFIETRSASITEPLLVLIIGYFLGLLAPTENDENVTTRAEATAAKPSRRQGLLTDRKTLAIGHLLTIIAMTGCLRILLKLPMIPYNIKELFRGNGSIPALFVFSMGLMWIGAGSVWLAHRLIQSRSPGLLLAPLTLAVSLISLALIWSGATSESITDIAGASNVFWFVTNKDMWGAFWRDVFLSLDAPEIIGLLETAIRYSMLYAPLTLCLGLMIYIRDRKPQCTHDRIETTGLAASALLFLWLCKAIAFDWTSTDNLNELIARDGEWGWGGGGYLYGLVFLLCMNSVLISGTSARSVFRIILAGLFSLVALPVAWWLLNQGLEQAVEKYDSVFSGVQFLLGPDRRSTLSQDVLLLRWCVVQVTGILVISSGIRLGKFLFPRPSSANH